MARKQNDDLLIEDELAAAFSMTTISVRRSKTTPKAKVKRVTRRGKSQKTTFLANWLWMSMKPKRSWLLKPAPPVSKKKTWMSASAMVFDRRTRYAQQR